MELLVKINKKLEQRRAILNTIIQNVGIQNKILKSAQILAQSYCGGESLVGMLSAVGKQVLWRRIMADETWEAQVFGKNKKGK